MRMEISGDAPAKNITPSAENSIAKANEEENRPAGRAKVWFRLRCREPEAPPRSRRPPVRSARLMGGLGGGRLFDQVADVAHELLLLVVEARVAGDLLQGGVGFGVIFVTNIVIHAHVKIAPRVRAGGRQRRLQLDDALIERFGPFE